MIQQILKDHASEVEILNEIAPIGYTIALNVRYLTPQFYVSTYPEKWIEQYTASRYVIFDPVTVWSTVNTGLVRWSDIQRGFMNFAGKRVFDEGRKFGLNFGASCVVRNANSSGQKCAIFAAREDRELSDAELGMLEGVLHRAIENVGPYAGLTGPELETLRDLADGLTHSEIAELRNISAATVKKRIERARRALGAKSAIQAVSIATKRGLIFDQPLF